MQKSGQDLWGELMTYRNKLNKAQSEFRERGEAMAKAEYEYDVAFAKAVLEEQEKKTPATLIEKLVKGKEEIAKKKRELNIAEVLYRSADKAIDNYKKHIGVLNDQIQREWSTK